MRSEKQTVCVRFVPAKPKCDASYFRKAVSRLQLIAHEKRTVFPFVIRQVTCSMYNDYDQNQLTHPPRISSLTVVPTAFFLDSKLTGSRFLSPYRSLLSRRCDSDLRTENRIEIDLSSR